jgi:uncharacterized protein YndB with AHSA1/START domain
MILQDSQLIESGVEPVVSFLENMDRHYLDWHPDHISFAWLDGDDRRHFHFEEMIGRWRLRMAMRVTRSADGRNAVMHPDSRVLSLVMPWMTFAVTDEPSGCRYTHRIKLRLGPFAWAIERTFLAPLRRHMREEAENLARIVTAPTVA